MGVSGVGKSTFAKGLSTLMRWPFVEGDALHPEANLAKMSSGQPLTDEDRWPWLRAIGEWISQEIAAGSSGVVTCSALRRAYRDLLREGRPEVVFCHLVAVEDLIANRIGPPGPLHAPVAAAEPVRHAGATRARRAGRRGLGRRQRGRGPRPGGRRPAAPTRRRRLETPYDALTLRAVALAEDETVNLADASTANTLGTRAGSSVEAVAGQE